MNIKPIIWEEYHYHHFEKDADWKWSVAIISTTIIIISILLSSITFAALIFVGTMVLLIHAFKKPKLLRYEINQTGIRIEQEKWSFSNMSAFYIEDNREHNMPSRILFETSDTLSPIIHLPLPIGAEQKDLHYFHEILSSKLEEKTLTESMFQKILEYLGF